MSQPGNMRGTYPGGAFGSMNQERVDSVSLETAIAIIRNCMTLMRIGDFNESVKAVIKNIVDIAEARSCRIMLLDNENQKAINFCEVLSDSFRPENMPGDGNIPFEVVKMWEKMIGDRDSVIVNGQDELDFIAERAPGLAMMMKRNQTTRLVMLPLRRGDSIIGFMYVINFNGDKVRDVKDLVELMSFFIATEIFNYQLMERLRRMGVEDGLTGLHNRNAMMNRIHSITEAGVDQPVGIISMDLNGLKRLNDSYGHEYGDSYIVHAAEVMKGVFGDIQVYRTGGDEFVAITEGMPEKEFFSFIDSVRGRIADDPEFNLAIGYYWSENGIEDMRTAFRRADESMYMDKKKYYSSHPESDRRGH